MTDRELLERAAKAAGYVVESKRSNGGAWCYPIDEQPDEDGDHPGLFSWNPLTDDGDALRLAVKLRIDALFDGHDSPNAHIEAVANMPGKDVQPWAAESMKEDPYAATRRAIVRAAAAMGGE